MLIACASNRLIKRRELLIAAVIESLEQRRLLSIAFAPLQVLPVNTVNATSAVTSADFNGDGFTDLAVAEIGTGSLAIFPGNGDGTFKASETVTDNLHDGTPKYSIVTAAFDNSHPNNEDIVVSSAKHVSIILGNGDGTFKAPTVLSLKYPTYNVSRVAIGDFVGDGREDLAILYNGGYASVQVLAGNGDGTFKAPVVTQFARSVVGHSNVAVLSSATGDFNGDGKTDLCISDANGTCYELLSDASGDGKFQSSTLFDPGTMCLVASSDVNGDGHTDVVIAEESGSTIYTLLGTGDTNGTFGDPVSSPGDGQTVDQFAVGDIDGDGNPDAVELNYYTDDSSVTEMTGCGDGTFSSHGKTQDTNPNAPAPEEGVHPEGLNLFPALASREGEGEAAPNLAPSVAKAQLPDIVVSGPTVVFLNNESTNGQAPAITSAASAMLTVNEAANFTITTTGSPAVTSVVEKGALPDGITFKENANGKFKLIGTPLPGSAATYPISFVAKNGVTPNAKQTFTLTVNNQPPVFTSDNSTTLTARTTSTFTVITTGSPAATITESGALPPGITFTAKSNGKAKLTGASAPRFAGTYPIVFTAKNGAKPNGKQTFNLIVQKAPSSASAPAIAPNFAADGIVVSSIGDDTILGGALDPLDRAPAR